LLFPAVWVNLKLLLKGTFFSKPFEKIWPLYFGFFGLAFLDIYLNRSRIISFFLENIKRIKKIKFSHYFIWLSLAIIAFAVANVYLGMKFFNFETLLASPKSSGDMIKNLAGIPGNFFSGYYALIFGLTPLVLFFLIASILFLIREKNVKLISEKKYVLVFLLFTLFYYLGSSASGVGATVRYQISIYPLAMVAAAIGAYWIYLKILKKDIYQYGAYLAFFSVSLFSLLMIKPYYLAYSSYLLPNQ
jgi:hypothetical protein